MSEKNSIVVDENSTQKEVEVNIDHNGLGNEDEECQTPTADAHKIPRALSCPPAPRKRKQQLLTFLPNRKFPKLKSYVFVDDEEVELFFGISSSWTVKKRRRSH